jgi:hypothetical protein
LCPGKGIIKCTNRMILIEYKEVNHLLLDR